MKTLSKTVLILASGLLSTIICLGLVYFIQEKFDANISGFYLFVFPVGALIIGIVSGLGYAGASYITNTRISRLSLPIVALIALLCYAGYYFVMFAMITSDWSMTNFFAGMKILAENSSLTIGKSSKSTIDNVGNFGYLFMIAEFAGFALGAVGPIYSLTGKAYCRECKQYLKSVPGAYHMPVLEGWDHSHAAGSNSVIDAKYKNLLKAEYEKTKSELNGKTLEEKQAILASLNQTAVHRNTYYINYGIEACKGCKTNKITASMSFPHQEQGTATETLGEIA